VYNPKVVRASAGALFELPIAGGVDAGAALAAARAGGAQCLGAVPRTGSPPESFDLTRPTCFVLGHETRGLNAELAFDALVTVPMFGAESLNLAMAATVLLFEAARARRVAGSAG
jgi:TrmH family RNA methyltransferase